MNCPSYQFDFVIAQVIEDVTQLDTTDPETELKFQVFQPSNLENFESKLVPWIGDTNKLWKFSKRLGQSLCSSSGQRQKADHEAKSLQMIKDKFF